jgi:hypothetical protein
MSSIIPFMSPPQRTQRVGPAYRKVVDRIDRMMVEAAPGGSDEEVLQKEVALGIGMSQTVYSQKRRGGRSHFFEDELDSIARYFRRRTGRPLIGFPHLEWDLMEACDRQVGGWNPKPTK